MTNPEVLTRLLSGGDLPVSIFLFVAGILSWQAAIGIWGQRNGGILTRIACVMLASIGTWELGSAAMAAHIYTTGYRVSIRLYPIYLTLQMIIAVPHMFVLVWVLPKLGKGKKNLH